MTFSILLILISPYASKSDVNSKQEVEVTEKQRIKQLPDEEVQGRLLRLVPKIDQITKVQ